MAKKRGRGRPKSTDKQIKTWFRYSEATIDELQALVDHFTEEAPPYAELTQRVVIAALIHHATQEVDAGRLSYGELFGVTAGASADG